MTYVYYCKECGKEIEVNHSIKESPTIICDECKNAMNIKVTGGHGFILKGIGWASQYPT